MTKHLSAALFVIAALAPRAARANGDNAEKLVKLFEHIAEDVDANKPDCDKIGIALGKHLTEDAATMKEIRAADAKMSDQEKQDSQKALATKYGARMKAAKAKMGPMTACRTNAKVEAYGKQVMQ